MNKSHMETILAVFIGVAIGIVATSGFWYLKGKSSLMSSTNTASITVTPSADKNSTKNTVLKLELKNSEEITILNSAIYDLEVSTSPSSKIALTFNANDYIENADTKGNYTKKIELDSGLNTITVTVFDLDGNFLQKEIKLVYAPK